MPRGREAKRGREPLRVEERWVDPLRDRAQLVERAPDVGAQPVERLGCARRVLAGEPAGELEDDGDGDQLLLDGVVQLALERATLVVVGEELRQEFLHRAVVRHLRPAVKGASTVVGRPVARLATCLAARWAAGTRRRTVDDSGFAHERGKR